MNDRLYKLVTTSAAIASTAFGLGVVLSTGTLATLFATSPFVDDRTEQAIADFLLTSARATAIAGIWSGSSGLLAITLASKPQQCSEAQPPEFAGDRPCYQCKYFSLALSPCAVHPLGKPQPECSDWEQR